MILKNLNAIIFKKAYRASTTNYLLEWYVPNTWDKGIGAKENKWHLLITWKVAWILHALFHFSLTINLYGQGYYCRLYHLLRKMNHREVKNCVYYHIGNVLNSWSWNLCMIWSSFLAPDAVKFEIWNGHSYVNFI